MAAIEPERGRAAPGVSGYSRLVQIPVSRLVISILAGTRPGRW